VCRSRSPRTRRETLSNVDCPICMLPLRGTDQWNCLRCNVACHVSCLRDDRTGRINLPNGCPTCRTTVGEIVEELQEPVRAPCGAVCLQCRRRIRTGELMKRCAAPKSHCIAVWHTQCFHYARYCPACGNNIYSAIAPRQHRQDQA